jgi:TNF receptor-associated factor 4
MKEGGFPSALFLSEPSEHLLCSICLDVMRSPIQCPQGHSFCRSCISSALASDSKCPMDRIDLQADSLVLNLSLSGIIDNLDVICPQTLIPQEQASKKRKSRESKGHAALPAGTCSWKGKLEQIENHQRECALIICECPNKGCHRSMLRGELQAHADTCPESLVQCEFCAASQPRRTVPAHRRLCPRTPVPCPNNCGLGPEQQTLVPRDELSAHRQEHCPLERRPCPHAGCGAKIVRRDLDAHLREHLVQEKEQLTERVVKLGAEAEAHKTRNAELQARGVERG